MENVRSEIRNPEKQGSGMEKIRIRDPGKHPGSATLTVTHRSKQLKHIFLAEFVR
jgi:hypothetical protein